MVEEEEEVEEKEVEEEEVEEDSDFLEVDSIFT